MRKDACAGTVWAPRSKRCRIPAREKKREASIDLNRGAAGSAGHFREARDYSARDIVETLRARGVFAERRHRLASVPTDANARIDFHFAKDRHTVGQRRFRPFPVANAIQRLAAMRARKRAHVLDHTE